LIIEITANRLKILDQGLRFRSFRQLLDSSFASFLEAVLKLEGSLKQLAKQLLKLSLSVQTALQLQLLHNSFEKTRLKRPV
jgi:hypothetical protein